MKTCIAITALAFAAAGSARVINKARGAHAPTPGGFKLEVTTKLNQVSYFDYTPAEVDPLPVSIEAADEVLAVTIVNANNDVTCTVKGKNGQIALFGGNYSNTYARQTWDDHAEWICCEYIVDYSKYATA
jgi:hypothetical protein